MLTVKGNQNMGEGGQRGPEYGEGGQRGPEYGEGEAKA